MLSVSNVPERGRAADVSGVDLSAAFRGRNPPSRRAKFEIITSKRIIHPSDFYCIPPPSLSVSLNREEIIKMENTVAWLERPLAYRANKSLFARDRGVAGCGG